ncbi:MAG: uncharacterized protein KVP18_001638 [Porospora cf. gigantea A]|uniref:uncharacterized protein n=2 Tax=Porospora cf. gigantea A TaxID=2853593 RepID=UPI00355962EA|nr:MAG: hypothetical protein KVP18_001638 [Porospora cf. gigantea A]
MVPQSPLNIRVRSSTVALQPEWRVTQQLAKRVSEAGSFNSWVEFSQQSITGEVQDNANYRERDIAELLKKCNVKSFQVLEDGNVNCVFFEAEETADLSTTKKKSPEVAIPVRQASPEIPARKRSKLSDTRVARDKPSLESEQPPPLPVAGANPVLHQLPGDDFVLPKEDGRLTQECWMPYVSRLMTSVEERLQEPNEQSDVAKDKKLAAFQRALQAVNAELDRHVSRNVQPEAQIALIRTLRKFLVLWRLTVEKSIPTSMSELGLDEKDWETVDALRKLRSEAEIKQVDYSEQQVDQENVDWTRNLKADINKVQAEIVQRGLKAKEHLYKKSRWQLRQRMKIYRILSECHIMRLTLGGLPQSERLDRMALQNLLDPVPRVKTLLRDDDVLVKTPVYE